MILSLNLGGNYMANICFNSIELKGDVNVVKLLILQCLYKHEIDLTVDFSKYENITFIKQKMRERDLIELEFCMTELPPIQELTKRFDKESMIPSNFTSVDDYVNRSISEESIGSLVNEDGSTSYFINFVTKWSPSISLVEAMAEEYPELEITFLYEEGGCGVAGMYHYIDGELEESISTLDSLEGEPDMYRFIMREYFEECVFTCKSCRSIYMEYEYDDGELDDGCPECDNKEFFYGADEKMIIKDITDKDDVLNMEESIKYGG